MRVLLTFLFLTLLARVSDANPPEFRTFLEKETMTPGDANSLIFNLLGTEKYLPDTFFTFPLDTILGKENIISTSGWTAVKNGWAYKIEFTAFKEGDIRIVPLLLNFRATDVPTSIFSEAKTLHIVAEKITDSTELQNIKFIHREPTSWIDNLPLMLSILAVFAFAALFLWWKWRKKFASQTQKSTAPPSPFWIIALQQLDFLEKKQLWQAGEAKQYHTELTEIIRNYLAKRFQISATKATSTQILTLLKTNPDVSENLLERLQQLFRTVDLVKFAKAEPPEDFHQQALDQARILIQETTPNDSQLIENQDITTDSESLTKKNSLIFNQKNDLKSVEISPKYAPKSRRFAAGLIDNLVWLGGSILVIRVIFWLLDELNFRDEGGFGTGLIALSCVFGLVFFTWFFHVFLEMHGATPGKIAFGIKTVDESGAQMTDKQARRRFFAKFNFDSFLLRGVETDLRRQAEHDHENNTVVLIRKLS